MKPQNAVYFVVKRLIDIIISGTALFLLLPLLVPLMIILRLTGEGKILYLQQRVGYKGNVFQVIKFATMLEISPNIGTGTITLNNDPRILPLGHFLRKTKINELPQIINVLKGDMTIVGPRPQTEECFNYFPEKSRDKIYQSKPGLTGIGSIVFRDEEEMLGNSKKSPDKVYREDIMPYKQELELWYLNNRSLLVDLTIIILTAIVIIAPKNNLHKILFKNLPEKSLQSNQRLGEELM